jgi:hypothetical protein
MSTSDTKWAKVHSIENTPTCTWRYMTDVKNWDDPPAEFQIAEDQSWLPFPGIPIKPGRVVVGVSGVREAADLKRCKASSH